MQVITDTQTLEDVCAQFSASPFLTVDTEFLRESTYWPQLCLIQIADRSTAIIIDAMAPGIDLSPFLDLMRNEDIEKVFHAARQDVEIIYKMGGFVPSPLFDTQIAAMVCGFGDSVSYVQLVGKITGAKLDKSNRFTDWSRRPLTQAQLEYALADVTHLRDVYHFLRANLQEQNRTHWVKEEMSTITSEETYRNDPEQAWKRLKMRARKPLDLAITQSLANWREREAQSRDVPRGRVLKDDAIYEIAAQKPADEAAFSRLRGLPNGFEKSKSGRQILQLIAQAKQIPDGELPKLPRHKPSPEGTSAAIDLMKILLKLVSENNGVASKVIATVDDLEKIATNNHDNTQALQGWRRELFGEKAIALLHGKIHLTFDGKSIVAREED